MSVRSQMLKAASWDILTVLEGEFSSHFFHTATGQEITGLNAGLFSLYFGTCLT